MSTDVSQTFDWPAHAPEKYRVLFPLGRGGMGSVEVALEEHQSFRRIVALKTMLAESNRDRRHKEMFLREARLALMLNHPNVVHAFAAGAEEERLYICMEYVEGASLDLLLARARELDGRLSPALAAYILAELCDGLHAAHELRSDDGKLLGVVHRDVSPHNVMVAYSGHVKVLDFGIAKIDESKLTHTGEVKGKTAYMAPEQALGDALDRRSDLFAVGAILYECIAGTRMWGPGSDVEVIRRLALDQPPRLLDTVPGAPPALAALQARLVARDPAARPASAGEVASALRGYLASCGERTDEHALRALMHRLFELEAAQRRHQLARALEGVVDPAGADALKKSLSTARAPLSDSERRMLARLRPRTVSHPDTPSPVGIPAGTRAAVPMGVPAATTLDLESPVVPVARRNVVPWLAAVASVAALTGVLAVKLTVGPSSDVDPGATRTAATASSTSPTLGAAGATTGPATSATSATPATSATQVPTTPAAVESVQAATPPARVARPGGHGRGPRPAPSPAPGSSASPRPEIDTRAF